MVCIRLAGLVICAVGISASALAAEIPRADQEKGPREAERPNIVLIMADDLGFADLGCYGSEIETPRLDALATDGLRFTQFYNTAKCHSSRVSLLTGLYCNQAGGESLSRGATVAEVLGPAGYSTMMVGKWHLSRQPTDFGIPAWDSLPGSLETGFGQARPLGVVQLGCGSHGDPRYGGRATRPRPPHGRSMV